MSSVTDLHDAAKRGDLERTRALLDEDASLANARSGTDARGTFPLHGLTPLGCAIGGTEGRWLAFSNATLDDWREAADLLRARGGVE
jgi:hypothetical protein